MEKVMQNKRFIKIICVALATLLWIYVSYQENPSMSKTVKNVPIVIVGEQALKENGFSVYSVSEKSVNVKATANRLTLARVTNKTVSASINVSSIKKAGKHVVPATVTSTVSSNASYYVKNNDITVVIEPILKNTFKIEPVITEPGNTAKRIDSYTLSNEKVTVFAPTSIMNDIGSVRTEAVETQDSSDSQTVRLVAYAKNGKILEGAEFNPAEITVSYAIADVKTVPVILKTADGNSYTLPSQYDVEVTGFGESFNNLKQIETMTVSLSGLEEGSSVSVKLNIPTYVKLKNDSDEIQIKLESKYFGNKNNSD